MFSCLFRQPLILVYLLFISFTQAGYAAEKSPLPIYLDDSFLSPALLMPGPPSPNSEALQNEIILIKSSMAKLSEAQQKLAIEDAENLSVTIFADTVQGFDIDKLPNTKMLFELAKHNSEYASNIFKNHFSRSRPYQADQEIKPCIAAPGYSYSRSYPSGHSTLGFTMGVVMAHLIPEQAPQVMQRANLYGQNRGNCGAHFPSDVSAGQVLGTLVAKELLKHPEFLELLEMSKQELIAAGLTH